MRDLGLMARNWLESIQREFDGPSPDYERLSGELMSGSALDWLLDLKSEYRTWWAELMLGVRARVIEGAKRRQ